KSFGLTVLLLDADPEWAGQDKSTRMPPLYDLKDPPLTEFPTKLDLQQFDVVILGDFDPHRWGGKMNEHLQNLADFVKERGGGLLAIGGPHYAPHVYKGTPLQDILPIDLLTEPQPPEPPGGFQEPYRAELTPVGRMHPILSFNSRDEKENDEIWNGLKEMYWW